MGNENLSTILRSSINNKNDFVFLSNRIIGNEFSSDLSDEELIRKYVKDEDERSFNSILKRYENVVFGLAYRVLRDPSVAEDILQEVFLILTKKLCTFREESKFSTWLYRVTLNVCFMYRKNEYKHKNNLSLDLEYQGDSKSDFYDFIEDTNTYLPDEESSNSEILKIIERELQNIPGKYRVVFILRDINGLTNHEVAKLLGISLAAVKSRILRARNFLKNRLKGKLKVEYYK